MMARKPIFQALISLRTGAKRTVGADERCRRSTNSSRSRQRRPRDGDWAVWGDRYWPVPARAHGKGFTCHDFAYRTGCLVLRDVGSSRTMRRQILPAARSEEPAERNLQCVFDF